MGKVKDLTGQRFGRLTAVEVAGRDKWGNVKWRCACECGSETVAVSASLTNGNTASCGCLQREAAAAINRTHGMWRSRIYKVWETMKQRCGNPLNKKYGDYGARGITYDPSWEAFENFLKDMGESYKEQLSLDRVDNNKGYSKENCRWATRSVQQRNQRKRADSKNLFKGIYETSPGRFAAKICVNRSQAYLGVFPTALAAATAYDDRCEELGCGRPNGTVKTTGE